MDVKRFSRRSLIATVLAAFAYPLYRVAVHNSWIVVTQGAKRIERGRCPVSVDATRETSLLVVGDTGSPSPQRASVVSGMRRLAGNIDPNAVVMLGDNFYEKGVQSTSDPHFQSDFENVFDRESFKCPFYPALGNHDYLGNTQAQIDYTEHSDRWRMMGTHYKVRYGPEESATDLFVIDTNPIDAGSPDSESQLLWLDQELAGSNATWKIVAGHHPCISGGVHGPSEAVNGKLGPLLTRHKVALYLSGHDHDLQLLDSGQGWLQLISGSGSKLRSTTWISKTEFATASAGFAWLLIQTTQLSVSIFGNQGRLFTKVISKSARWESQLSRHNTRAQMNNV